MRFTSYFKLASFIASLFLLSNSMVAQSTGCHGFDFDLAPNYSTGTLASGQFASGDFNGDGKLDLVSTNEGQSAVSLILGDGAGGFGPPRSFPAGLNPKSITAGDFNSDGKGDVLVGALANKLALLLNDGNGGFQAPIMIIPPIQSGQFWELRSADLNGDGHLDVAAVMPQSDPNILIFLGDGFGNFTLAAALYSGPGTSIPQMDIGDVDNDGRPDVLVAQRQYFGNTLDYVAGTSGPFSVTHMFSPVDEIVALKIVDVNHDNQSDLAVATASGIRLWTRNGSGYNLGNLVSTPYFPPNYLTAGDFNGDGLLDLAALMGTAEVMVAYGRGTGALQDQTFWTVPNNSGSLISADLNQDGRQDLVYMSSNSGSGLVTPLLNNNNLGFSAPQSIAYGGTDIVAADFNRDNLLDLVTVTDTQYSTTSEVVIAANDGHRALQPDTNYATPAALQAFAVGDFNADGKNDTVTVHSYSTKQIAVEPGNGAGAVGTAVTTNWPVGVVNVVAGDFNGDGKDDVFIVDETSKGYALLGLGDGTFNTTPTLSVDLDPNITPIKSDFNHDGKPDLLTFGSGIMSVWLGVGNGTFTRGANVPLDSRFDAVGDLNGDGNLDVVGLNNFPNVTLTRLFGDGAGGFVAGPVQSVNGDGQAVTVASADFNGDGFSDIAFSRSVVRDNLVVIPSTNQTSSWEAPINYSVGGMSGGAVIAVGDYDHDGKPDIGYTHLTARGVIYNKSGLTPCLSINDVTVTEGDSSATDAIFTVSLSGPSAETVRVNYSLTANNATAGTDYENVSGRLEILPGQTSANIVVPVKGDVIDEFDETFQVNLSSPMNAVLADSVGVGTIVDNDAEPALTIADVSKAEDASGGFQFQVSLSGPSEKPISFQYMTADGTATAGVDYSAGSGTVNIAPAINSGFVGVFAISDQMYEPNETFFVNISNSTNAGIAHGQGLGTITNDDPIPTLTIVTGFGNEGDVGLSPGIAPVAISNPSYLPITVDCTTSNGTALAGVDYIGVSGSVTIPPGQLSGQFTVQLIGNTVNGPDKSFNVTGSNLSNATAGTLQSTFQIFDDENVGNDFDHDGRADFAVFRPSNKTWYILRSFSGTVQSTPYGLSDDVPVSGDYNGDGRTDIAVWRPSTGNWYTPIANRSTNWGQAGDIPVAGDYDNDGILDVAVFRSSTATWYILLSSTGGVNYIPFGLAGDVPIPADYDGDGKTDVAVFRPSEGNWYILRSSDNGFVSIQFGTSTDKLVPGDYDGDGKADVAVWRPSSGTWYVLRSSDSTVTFFQFGADGDKPVPGNYDGDAKTDFAVYRGGAWYVLLSSNGSLLTKQFGLPGDVPIASVSGN